MANTVLHAATGRLFTIWGMYSAQVLDHFQNPRNPGEIENADARIHIENPACGDVLELTARSAAGRIVEIRFRAKGCVSAMACASALTEMVVGRTIREARELRREELVEHLGGLPEASVHAGYLAMDALRALLKEL
ncbi:MAG: iron-sulfur cluster assembly scaffold protein [Terriglobales bacterium]